MLLSLRKTGRIGVNTVTVVLLAWSTARADVPSVFDLEWNGPETSTVQECVGEDTFCFDFPIVGSLGVGLESNSPYLLNVDSDILLPPQTPNSPPVISPNLWFNFDLLEGEYLPTENEDDVAMVFRPAEIGGVLRAYEIFVNITDSGQFLELTGGIEQSATSPMEPDVRFSVSGQLETTDSIDIVDGADFLALQRGYGGATALEPTGEGVTTDADFQRWRAEFGTVQGSSANASLQTIPEPATLTLAALLAAAQILCCTRRRIR